MYLMWLGYRNVLRNRRRSILMLLGLSIGTALLIFGMGWVRGYFTTVYRNIIDFDTGHIQVYHPDFLEEEVRTPLEYSIEDYRGWRARLASLPGVAVAAGRIEVPARLSWRGRQVYVRLRGIDPPEEARLTTIEGAVVEGAFLVGRSGLLLGKELADRLGVGVGDPIAVRVMDRYGVENVDVFPVQGLFSFGYPVMDRNMAFMDLESLQRLLDMGDGVTHLVIRLEPPLPVEKGLLLVSSALEGSPYRAYRWEEFAKALVAAVQADSGSFVVFLAILFILTGANILNSFSMSVYERTREFATLRAMGMRRATLRGMILSEASVLAVGGTILGWILSAGAVWYLSTQGLDVSKYLPSDLPMPFGTRFYGDYRWYDFLIAGGFTSLLSWVAAVLPSRRASRLVIAEALREVR
ncbi:ABC transporter permease [Spirochaeta thermophila]|uniref:Permease component of an ABC transporter system n=1 Tax=Winmispira thermophila (strain ATCC 49972 / DSM 6192 / RI 19.B1) TaxID=665571 RepID=E0RRR2_WINT6|nr:FtsX-like permease family protein [Spirochaeta thermophila]ADN03166.1 permease component of an ABC transporter system [Spirochaeta thermophila DSM 6192]